jgi:hypothetical protein
MIGIIATVLLTTTASAAPIQLGHQGRLLDSFGGPVDGSHTLEITLRDAEDDVVYSETFTNYNVEAGYYSVILENGTPSLDSSLLDSPPLYVGVSVDHQDLGMRSLLLSVPYAAQAETAQHAVQADVAETAVLADTALRIPLAGAVSGTSCSDPGIIVYDTDLGALRICTGSTWNVNGTSIIAQNGSIRRWSDGSEAVSCLSYLEPQAGYLYAGATGDGTYSIDVDGAGPLPSTEVACDMANGGWSIFHHSNESEFRSTGCEAPECNSHLFTYDAPTAVITHALGMASTAAQFISKRCNGSLMFNPTVYGAFYNPAGRVDPVNWPNVSECNLNDAVWRTSAGDVTNPSFLPIVRITNGDTGDASEDAYLTLGPVRVK